MDFNITDLNTTLKVFSEWLCKKDNLKGKFILRADVQSLKVNAYKKVIIEVFYHCKNKNVKILSFENTVRILNNDFKDVVLELNKQLQFILYDIAVGESIKTIYDGIE